MCTNVTIIRLEDCRRHFLYLKRPYMVCGGTHTSNTNANVVRASPSAALPWPCFLSAQSPAFPTIQNPGG